MTEAQAIRNYLELILLDIIKEQRNLGFRYTGASAASMYVEATDEGGELHAAQYIQTNFKGIGRKPGAFPPPDSIAAWVAKKAPGLKPYLVSRKMALEGNAVYRGVRKGIDVQAIKKKHRSKFKKESIQAIKDRITYPLKNNSFKPKS